MTFVSSSGDENHEFVIFFTIMPGTQAAIFKLVSTTLQIHIAPGKTAHNDESNFRWENESDKP